MDSRFQRDKSQSVMAGSMEARGRKQQELATEHVFECNHEAERGMGVVVAFSSQRYTFSSKVGPPEYLQTVPPAN